MDQLIKIAIKIFPDRKKDSSNGPIYLHKSALDFPDAALISTIKETKNLYLKSTDLPAWHPPQKKGFFRHIVVRKSFAEDKLLINLVTSSEGLKKFDPSIFVDFLVSKLGKRLGGVQHTVNDNVADRAKIENGNCQLLYGEPVVTERLLGLDFEISMESFFQTNPACAERLYNKALEYENSALRSRRQAMYQHLNEAQ